MSIWALKKQIIINIYKFNAISKVISFLWEISSVVPVLKYVKYKYYLQEHDKTIIF